MQQVDLITREALAVLPGGTSLLEILTLRIISGKIPVQDARQIVINHAHARRQAIVMQAPPAKLREIELAAIRETLDRNHWHRGNTAHELGISRSKVQRAITEIEKEKSCRVFSASA